jgi:ABC-type transport system involved in multi-copper enzyme maturation permease subunit
MLRSIFLWELKYHLKYPLIYGMFLVFCLFTFGAEVSSSVTIGEAIGNEYRNASISILRWLSIMSIMGILVVTAFVAGSIQRDFARETHELIFSRPVRKFDYLMGRFGGSMVLSICVLIGSALGIVIGSLMPWLEPDRVGPFDLGPYLYGFLVIVLPNLFLSGAIFFTIAGLTRSMLTTFMSAVILLAGWLASLFLMKDLESQSLASLVDPFCVAALESSAKYWTIVEKNTALPPLGGTILLNRLIWIGMGFIVLLWGYRSFRFSVESTRTRSRKRGPRIADETEAGVLLGRIAVGRALPHAVRSFSPGNSLRQFLRQTRIETVGVMKSIPFLVILAFGVFNVVAGTVVTGELFGTSIYPVTHSMLRAIEGSYIFLLVIIIAFYSGDLIWKERSLRLNEVYDALPASNWVLMGSKLAALVAIALVFTLAGMLTTMAYQISRGYTDLELGLYAKGLIMALVPYVLICVLACAVQIFSGNKFAGYLVMIVFLVSREVFQTMGWEHHLYQYASSPKVTYSDMNGYGHFVKPFFWYNLYWVFFALVLATLGSLFLVRGTESSWRARLAQARLRLRTPARASLAVGLIGLLGTGSYIYYNTNILNDYIPKDEKERRLAEYEKNYRQYKDVSMPRITDVTTSVDIFPQERRVEIEGRYRLVNKEPAPIDSLHLSIPKEVTINSIEFRDHTLALADSVLGYYIYELEDPLAPGDSMMLAFNLTLMNPGFVNHGSNIKIVYNGTFFHNLDYLPTLGYNESEQLQDRYKRRKHGLPPVQRMNKIDDEFARRYTYFINAANRIRFTSTIGTDSGQIAVAPGYLTREWTEGDRRYFQYAMDEPFLNFYSYLSADYTVKRDRWNDVQIEIYHHTSHNYNVDRMIDAVKKSLEYFTAHFGPYQHRVIRIIEFPGYEAYAQSFASTIPYSEVAGFITDVRESDIDYVTYITAHEVAHQWWAHQVIGGNVQGATLLSESLAQYSSLMVMEKVYGKDKMRRFLKYELDKYLRDRGTELVEEMPLSLVESQPYIYYQKGSLVMYALKDYLGEDVLNGAIRRFRDDKAYQEPPYTTSREFLEYIREVTPDSLSYVLEDMFETITLYMNHVEEATCSKRDDGTYVVNLKIEAKKLRADGLGMETEIPIDDYVDIGVFGEEEVEGKIEEKVLYMKKHRIDRNSMAFELVVDELPVRAGIDPYNKLIDRNSNDNVKRVSGT